MHRIPYDLTILLLEKHSEPKANYSTVVCRAEFVAPFFMLGEVGNPKCPSADKWVSRG